MDTFYVLLAYFMGLGSGWVAITMVSMFETSNLKRENERLNSELNVLTKRDSKGRFTGGK
jgi:hypothetical protein